MHHTQSSQLSGHLKSLQHLRILQAQYSLVGHKELKTAHSLLHHPLHLPRRLQVPARNRRVQSVVTVHLRVCPPSPSFVRHRHTLFRRRNGKVKERSCSSCDCCLASHIEIINCITTHERELHVGMCINTPRDDKFITALNNLCVLARNVLTHQRNLPILNQHISNLRNVCIHYSSIFQQITLSKPCRIKKGLVKKFSHLNYQLIYINQSK